MLDSVEKWKRQPAATLVSVSNKTLLNCIDFKIITIEAEVMQCSRVHMCVCVSMCLGGCVLRVCMCVSAGVCSSNGCWNFTNNNIFIIVCSSVQRKKKKRINRTQTKGWLSERGSCIVRFGKGVPGSNNHPFGNPLCRRLKCLTFHFDVCAAK